MIEKETIKSENYSIDLTLPNITIDEKKYKIACSFSALQVKGVEDGNIPGISPKNFLDLKLSDYLYRGKGGLLSSGEFLILEFLLNLFSPGIYDEFNLGRAINIWDDQQREECN